LGAREFRGAAEGGIALSADHRSTRTRTRGRPDLAIAAGVLALFAGVVAGFAWSHPTTASATLAYTQSGRLSYSAPTSTNSIYGRAGLKTGDPIYAAAVRRVTVSYDYYLSAGEPTKVSGSEQLVATISNGQGLSRTIPLQSKSSFSGTSFHANGTLNLDTLQSAASAFDRAAGSPTASAGSLDVSIAPTISVRGRLAQARLRTTFDQAASFTYSPGYGTTPASLIPSASGQGAVNGLPTTGSGVQPSVFTASSPGSVEVPNAKAATLWFGLRVTRARLISLGVLGAGLLVAVVLGLQLLGDATSKDERVRIATRYGTSLVEVEDLPGPPGIVLVELSSFDGLREVARRLECPVLHHEVRRDGPRSRDVYAVVDSGTLYRYTTGQAALDRRICDESFERTNRAKPAHRRLELTAGDRAIDHFASEARVEAGAPAVGFSSNGEHSQA
jgi:hypothetical protein